MYLLCPVFCLCPAGRGFIGVIHPFGALGCFTFGLEILVAATYKTKHVNTAYSGKPGPKHLNPGSPWKTHQKPPTELSNGSKNPS